MILLIIILAFLAVRLIYYLLEFILRLFGKSFSNKEMARRAYIAAGGSMESFDIWWKIKK